MWNLQMLFFFFLILDIHVQQVSELLRRTDDRLHVLWQGGQIDRGPIRLRLLVLVLADHPRSAMG